MRSSPPCRWLKRSLWVGLACELATLPSAPVLGCSTILTGRGATTDGSVMMSHSCDGDVMGLVYVMRDAYEGTEFDVTSQPVFQVEAGRSPLACPWGPPELFELLKLKPERAICTPTSGYVFVARLQAELPAAIGNLLWFAYGPADTSCFVPLYAGVTDLPDDWDHPANFTRIDRQQPQWNFRLVHNLTHRLPYRKTIQAVQQMIHPAERNYVELQPRLEQAALQVLRTKGPEAAEAFLTAYAFDCTTQVGSAYATMVDDLLYRFLVGDPELGRSASPRIAAPALPDAERLR